MELVRDFYDLDQHSEWERLDRHRTEFAVTMRALREFLPPAPARIIDVGGGPGRYAIALAKLGYEVTLVDLAPENIGRAARYAQANDVQLQSLQVANALDLGAFAAASFDAVLLMGPLYHLIDLEDREQAVREAARILTSAGILFAAYLTRYSALRVCAERFPQWLYENPDYAERLLTSGVHQGEWGFTTAYHAHTGEIQPFMDSRGFAMLQMIGCDGIAAQMEQPINALEGGAWEWWADLNYRLGKRSDLHGAATHLLYVGQKSPGG